MTCFFVENKSIISIKVKIINFLWHFSTGGIGKCFLTYNKLGDVASNLYIKSVCVILDSKPCDCQPLLVHGIEMIHIKGYFDFSWMTKMKDIVNEEKPDAFFCHGHNGPIMLSLLQMCNRIRIPMICTCHGVNLDVTKKTNRFLSMLWMYIYKQRIVRKVICVEQYTPPLLFKKGIDKDKVVTVYNGINPSSDVAPINLAQYCKDVPVIISASRLTRIKGINYLIDALAILKEKKVKFCYFCIGNGEEEEILKGQAKKRGLTNGEIYFIGYQNNVPEWLATCDIFVLPSLEEFHSIAILEAMRAQKAIVATDIGGNPESLRDGKDALLVPAMNTDALAEALIRLLTDNELRNYLSRNAHEQFEKRFTIDVMMRNLANEILSTKL